MRGDRRHRGRRWPAQLDRRALPCRRHAGVPAAVGPRSRSVAGAIAGSRIPGPDFLRRYPKTRRRSHRRIAQYPPPARSGYVRRERRIPHAGGRWPTVRTAGGNPRLDVEDRGTAGIHAHPRRGARLTVRVRRASIPCVPAGTSTSEGVVMHAPSALALTGFIAWTLFLLVVMELLRSRL